MKRAVILERLARHVPLELPSAGARQAAVLVPLRVIANEGDDLEVVLTRRAPGLNTHAGQVAFPGGGIDPGDPSVEHAALREAEEELAIPPGRVQLVGRLDDMLTITGFHVRQIVGIVPADVELVPEPREVARVFSVPVGVLLDPHRWHERQHPFRGENILIWHLDWDGEDVWGATAMMLRGLVDILKAGEP